MPLPPDRKLARSKGPWARLVAAVGLAAFSCTFPDYRFDATPAETCDNDMQDEGELGVDCGGNCDPCPCQEDEDCLGTDDVCEDGECRGPCENGECSPTCTDEERNGDETDTDCGGSCTADCAIGKKCEVGDDCTELVCENKMCQPPRCDDGVLNGTEPWEDCGGECTDKCENGEPCFVAGDCESDTCVDTDVGDRVCAPPLCTNRVTDEGESDVDCGGSNTGCPRCGPGKICNEHDDCADEVCDDTGECADPECDDEVENGDETDVDCGGPDDCPRCGDTKKCDEDSDCRNKICTEGKCQEAACNDGVSNGDESDLDCGGSCDGCSLGEDCYVNGDCAGDMTCDSSADDSNPALGECVSCDDGEQNGSELGVDCGGRDCELCQPGDICSDDAGCVTYRCANESCVTGLELDYRCGQCGYDAVTVELKFTVTLRNMTDAPIDVSDVEMRYYLTPTGASNFSFECSYGEDELNCGSQRLVELPDEDKRERATHYIQTVIGATTPIPAEGSVDVLISVPFNGSTNQGDDYSFTGSPQPRHQDITLHRQGTLIWGTLPE